MKAMRRVLLVSLLRLIVAISHSSYKLLIVLSSGLTRPESLVVHQHDDRNSR